jgi:hypothetical protein
MKKTGTPKKHGHAILGSLIWVLFGLCSTATAASDTKDFQEPVDALTLSGRNDYGTYNLIKGAQFHGGIDVKCADRDPLDFDTPVKASQSGVVHKVFGLENEMANLLRCGGGWESSTHYGSEGNFFGSHHNHGFGMTVIIKHENDLFTLYAHLNCIEPGISPGVQVQKGQKIGIMGNSAYEYQYCNCGDCGAGKGFGPHLHFEIKDRGVLCDETDYGSNFAYTSAPPDQYGYRDPILFLNKSKIFHVRPFPVRVFRETLLHPGPGTQYGRLTNARNSRADLYPPSEFVVYRKAVSTSGECASEVWYQIYLPCLNTIGDCEGWICADNVATSSRPVVEVVEANHELEVRARPSGNSKVVAKVYSGQKFVYSQTHSSGSGCESKWFRICLPTGTGYLSGWICGDHLGLLDSP